MLLEIDRVIDEKYVVEAYLREGTFAEVYRVNHDLLGKQAIKILKTPLKDPTSRKDVQKALSEAIILSNKTHPNIIRVFDAGILTINDLKYAYFTMEYVPGGNLESFRVNHRTQIVNINDTINIIKQICEGLALAHGEDPPIIHRDIKPQNIMVGYDFQGIRIKISDFGLAKEVNKLTLIASACGTPLFKPPECLKDIDSTDGDVWAIGSILYILLTDKLPFPVTSHLDFITGNCWKKELILPSHFNPMVDEKLEAIVVKSLEKERSNRYKDAKEMLEDLMALEFKKEQILVPTHGKKISDLVNKYQKTPEDEAEINEMVFKAIELSKVYGKLDEAADLLEEAINKHPDIRKKYEHKLRNWRRNIIA